MKFVTFIQEKSTIRKKARLVSAADLPIQEIWCERIFGSELSGGYSYEP